MIVHTRRWHHSPCAPTVPANTPTPTIAASTRNRWRARSAVRSCGWSRPAVVLEADIFEAGHTYRLKGLNKFLTVIEAQAAGRRTYKAYLANRLDGQWTPLAATSQ